LETVFAAFCAEHHFAPQGIVRAASIDLKKDEPGLAAFCRAHDWKMDFYTAAALRTAKGRFTSSGFVQSITGVDNVCERAAVLAADGVLFIPKWARDGVTLAVALAPFAPDWRWKNDEP
jgi:cobalt-precorrin 5A hydrolase